MELPLTRRVLTGTDKDGLSCVVEDSTSPAVAAMAVRPGFRSNNIWRTVGSKSPIDAPDSVMSHSGVLPPPGGTVIRVIDFPPQHPDPEEARRQLESFFAEVYPDAKHQADHASLGMHITDTIDYAVVLHGEMVAILEKEECVLGAGDILIQRGTNHAWANRSGSPARMLFVLVDAERRPT